MTDTWDKMVGKRISGVVPVNSFADGQAPQLTMYFTDGTFLDLSADVDMNVVLDLQDGPGSRQQFLPGLQPTHDELTERVAKLEASLFEAVSVAYHRGAHEWARKMYPDYVPNPQRPTCWA